MTSYTPNIPQPGDDPSDSQDQILQNFQTLNTGYGTTGDHYPWTNTTPVEGRKHAKVTLPGLPTANPPGDIIPTPGLNEGVQFGLTTASITRPFWRRDNTTLNFPMVPIWAFGQSSVGVGPVIAPGSLNLDPVTPVTRLGVGQYRFNFNQALPNTDYVALYTFSGFGAQPIVSVQSKAVNNVVIQMIRQDGSGFTDGSTTWIGFAVLLNYG